MHRLGCTSREGLSIIDAAWSGQVIEDETHWQVVARINRSIIEQLIERDLAREDATQDDIRRVIDHWTFPLATPDLSELKVSRAELAAERERWSPE